MVQKRKKCEDRQWWVDKKEKMRGDADGLNEMPVSAARVIEMRELLLERDNHKLK